MPTAPPFKPADRERALLAWYAGAERMRAYPADRDALVEFIEEDSPCLR